MSTATLAEYSNSNTLLSIIYFYINITLARNIFSNTALLINKNCEIEKKCYSCLKSRRERLPDCSLYLRTFFQWNRSPGPLVVSEHNTVWTQMLGDPYIFKERRTFYWIRHFVLRVTFRNHLIHIYSSRPENKATSLFWGAVLQLAS
jgi:hypothetical protein